MPSGAPRGAASARDRVAEHRRGELPLGVVASADDEPKASIGAASDRSPAPFRRAAHGTCRVECRIRRKCPTVMPILLDAQDTTPPLSRRWRRARATGQGARCRSAARRFSRPRVRRSFWFSAFDPAPRRCRRSSSTTTTRPSVPRRRTRRSRPRWTRCRPAATPTSRSAPARTTSWSRSAGRARYGSRESAIPCSRRRASLATDA